MQFVELLRAAIQDRLPPIPIEELSEEFKNKADPNKFIFCGPIKESAPPAKGKAAPAKAPTQPQP